MPSLREGSGDVRTTDITDWVLSQLFELAPAFRLNCAASKDAAAWGEFELGAKPHCACREAAGECVPLAA